MVGERGGTGAGGWRFDVVADALIFVGDSWSIALRAMACVLRGNVRRREVVRHMASIGVDSLPIIVATAVSTGAVLAFYMSDVLVQFGADAFTGGTIALTFLLELGPLLAGVMVAARSGAAIAAEIGTMVVTEQVDALRSMAVSPIAYLVAPRLVACVALMPICGLVSDVAGIGGSIVMASARGVPVEAFLDSVRLMANETDLIKGLIKTLWFGLTIVAVASRQGLRAQRGAAGVGRATTSSVVLCVVLIFVSDFFLAQLLMGASVASE
jgi:phospholipid/cholesterol/gamma-HCH transport system permease protein